MSMSAAGAALAHLEASDAAAIRRLHSTGTALIAGLRGLAAKHEVALLVQGPGPVFAVTFTDASEIYDYRSHKENSDEEAYARFCEGMRDRGIRLTGRGVWFVSTAHSDADVAQTLDAADETLASL